MKLELLSFLKDLQKVFEKHGEVIKKLSVEDLNDVCQVFCGGGGSDSSPDPGEDPKQDPVSGREFKLLSNKFKLGKSDEQHGKNYLLLYLPTSKPINKVTVSGEEFLFHRIYIDGGLLYYGPEVRGDIEIFLTNGDKYLYSMEDRGGEFDKTFKLKYHKRTNPDRATFYAYKSMSSFPSEFKVFVPGYYDQGVLVENRGNRFEKGRFLVKESDVPGRGLTVLVPSDYKGTEAYIKY